MGKGIMVRSLKLFDIADLDCDIGSGRFVSISLINLAAVFASVGVLQP